MNKRLMKLIKIYPPNKVQTREIKDIIKLMTRTEKIDFLLENFKRDVGEFRPDWLEETYNKEKELVADMLNDDDDNQLDFLIEMDGPVFFTSPGKSILEELVENYEK